MDAAIRELVERTGAQLGDAAILRVVGLVQLWLSAGRAVNITGDLSLAGVLPHVEDALQTVAAAQSAGARGAWLDVGSGGGFPGLVVAACGDWPVALVEPRERRAGLLGRAVAELGLRGRVVRARAADDGSWEHLDVPARSAALARRFGVLSARAVWPPSDWMARARSWVAEDGVVLLHGDRGSFAGYESVDLGDRHPSARVFAFRPRASTPDEA